MERDLLAQLGPALPVPVPHWELVGTPSALFPYAFVGYRKLPGISVMQLLDREAEAATSTAADARLARELGESLSAVHGFDVAASGIELEQAELDALQQPLGPNEVALDHIVQEDPELAGRVRDEITRATDAACPVPSPDRVLTHSDLDVEHLLVEPGGAHLTGIIDWADAELGAAVWDFLGVYHWKGPDFVEQVLSHYRGPVRVDDLEWIRRRLLDRSLESVAYGRMAGRADYLRSGLRGIRRALG